jgi:hypothetical protein
MSSRGIAAHADKILVTTMIESGQVKVAYGSMAVYITSISLWAGKQFYGVEIPAEVAASIGGLAALVISHFLGNTTVDPFPKSSGG